MLTISSDRAVRWLRAFTVIVLAVSAVYFVVVSWRWRLAVDSPVMHYVVFLMRHGLKPYRDISDNNMPGAYFIEAMAMMVFGWSDLGWRLYEFSLLGVLILALVLIARRWDWLAGLFAGGFFLVLHAAEGPQYAGERELALTVLVLLGYLALFGAVDRVRPAWMLVFGLLSGLAASIKPTFLPLPLVLLVLALAVLHRRGRRVLPFAGFALAGLLVVFGLALWFLVREGVLREFLFVVTTVTPAYLGIPSKLSNLQLLAHAMPNLGFVLLVAVIPLGVANWRHFGAWDWKRWALLFGLVFGFLSYIAQHKGFWHHRYTLLVFFYLLAGLEVFCALGRRSWLRVVAAAALLLILVGSVPRSLPLAGKWQGSSDLEMALERDFAELGGPTALDDKVQCFDLVYGCLNALYHQGIVENTGFTGDLLFFSPRPGAATNYYRERYWRLERQDPPSVMVLSNQELLQTNNYDRVERWPEFADYLRANFTEVVERRFEHEAEATHVARVVPVRDQDGYRIYVRNGSPLMARAEALRIGGPSGK